MIFREATITDIPQIQLVRNSVKENILSNPNLVTDEDCRVFMFERGKGWVCEIDQHIVGFAIADLKEENIWALFVHPDFERKRIGKTLHDLMLNWYFDQPKQQVWLGTAPGTRAEQFYHKAGWRENGLHGKGEIKFEMTRTAWLSRKKFADFAMHILQVNDAATIQQIANWYEQEWKIPTEKTIQKLAAVTTSKDQFQVVLTFQNKPIATGGIYHHVGLLDKEPRFNIHPHWLALVYTVPEKRGQGLGAQLCAFIEWEASKRAISELHLFTDTAERLYERLGWCATERVSLGARNVVVMRKTLN